VHLKSTHPPNVAYFSLPSTLEHKIFPEPHTLHVLDEPIEAEPAGESVTSMDLKLAFPFVVQVSKVQDLTINNKFSKDQMLYVHRKKEAAGNQR
jgi:hypothetical protein